MTFVRFALRPTGARPLRRREASHGRALGLAAMLATSQLAGALPVAAAGPPTPAAEGAGSVTTQPTVADAGLQPTIHYEDLKAHEHDRIAFLPGGRVTVGFQPRTDDGWTVDGDAPRALPAGRVSGQQMVAGSAAQAESAEAVAGPATANPPMAAAATRLRREVFGFLPYWEVNSAVLDYEVLSTIAYFSVGANRNGNLIKVNSDGSTTTGWGGWTSSRMTQIINDAHRKGTRVVLTISVFAWTSTQAETQAALLGNPAARLNLASLAAQAVRDRGADGINLDFEPIASGYGDEFAALVREVRTQLNNRAPGYQLTFDTTGFIGNYPLEAATAAGAADAVFVMGYDYRGASSGTAGSIDPMSGPAYDLTDTVLAYTARIPASKVILGNPWYGRAWSTVSDGVNAATQTGTKFGASASVLYDTAIDYAAQYGRRWDSREVTPWVAYRKQNCSTTYGCVMTWRQIYYDDAASLKARYDLAIRSGLRGVGIWALGYDGTRPELKQALAEKFLDDRSPPIIGVKKLSSPVGVETYVVAWVGNDVSGIASYDVQVSIDGGNWHDWLRGTTAAYSWYSGADGHGFAFRARGRDTKGNVSAWNVATTWTGSPALAVGGFGQVLTDGLNVRSAPGTAATSVGTAAAGSIVAITGGPVSADGFTWYEVSQPITEWAPVGLILSSVWVAASGPGVTHIVAAPPPNTTTVVAPGRPAPGARYAAVEPARLLDTRSGNGLAGAFGNGVVRSFQVTGRGGVPAGAVAVTGTLTAVKPTGAGYASLGPSAAVLATTSMLNVPKGDVRSTGVTVRLAADGSLAARFAGAGASSHLLFDVTGYFVAGSAGSTYKPLAPSRIVDSRLGLGLAAAVDDAVPQQFAVAGHGGVPAGAVAVTGNLTVTGQTSNGYLFLGPTATAAPTSSTINMPRGDTRATGVTVALGAGGTLGVVLRGLPGSRAHVVFDVTGYFVADGTGRTFYPVDPVRLLDTRFANGLADPFASGVARGWLTAGRGTIPIDSAAVTGTLTVTGQTTAGVLSLGPVAVGLAGSSTLNFPKGDTRANGVAVQLAGGGALGGLAGLFSGTSSAARTHVLFDATGYYR